jgi:hypothetical protein
METKDRNRASISLAVFVIGAVSLFYFSSQKTVDLTEEPLATVDKPGIAADQEVPATDNSVLSESKVLPQSATPTPAPDSPSGLEAKSSFTDENYENWMAMSAEFYSEKQKNPEKYKAGVDFLLNTLIYGNVDKMLSQAGGALFNINDPELVPTYENILLDSDANISSEGVLRILSLYIYQAPSTETESFKKVMDKYQKYPSVPVRHVAEKWPEFRKGK